MTNIAVGTGNVGTAAAGSSVSTTLSNPTGNLYYAVVISSQTTYSAISVSDSVNGAYTQIGTTLNQGTQHIDRFYVKNASGNASLVITGTPASGTPNMTILAVEVQNADPTAPLVSGGSGNASTFASLPFSDGGVTIGTPPSQGTLLLSSFTHGYFTATITFVPNNTGGNPATGWALTPAVESTGNSGTWSAGAIAYLLQTVSGTYNAEWSDGGSANSCLAAVDAFQGGSGGGGGGSTIFVRRKRKIFIPYYFSRK